VEPAQDLNAAMPAYVTSRVVEVLNDRGTAVRGAHVLVLGVTYKPDVGDLRESAAVEVVSRLARKGAQITFHDPFIDRLQAMDIDLSRTDLSPERIREADAVLLLTPHSSYDLAAVIEEARLLFDARNAVGLPRPASVVTL